MTDAEFADQEHVIYQDFRDGKMSRELRDAYLNSLRGQFDADLAREREQESREDESRGDQ